MMDAATDAAAPLELWARGTAHGDNADEDWRLCARRVLVIVLPAHLPAAADGHSEIEPILVSGRLNAQLPLAASR